MFHNDKLSVVDPALAQAISQESMRQEAHIELIASENYTSPQVMAAQGSVLTNKYAEGYPKKRYYGGCEYVDEAELLAIERARTLFGCDYVNVQPHSGSGANSAAFMALIKPHDKILGMRLSEGGHLTHGASVNFSGKIYDGSHDYGLTEAGLIDYNQVEDAAKKEKPKLIVAGFSAYSQFVDWQAFKTIADSVGAFLLADIAHVAGLIATDLYPSPIGIADVITTTTHKTLRGPRGGLIMANDPDLSKRLNSAVFPGYQGGPLMHVIAAKAVAFQEALQPEFKTYQQQVLKNADIMAQRLIERGLDIVSGGTKNHLMLINLIKQSAHNPNLTGKTVDAALGRVHITVNKNAVPNDPKSPFVTSGIRLGTPAITTRGFKEAECVKIADWIADIIDNFGDDCVEARVQSDVVDLCKHYLVYDRLVYDRLVYDRLVYDRIDSV